MRDFLDSILAFISAPSLTDVEFDTITLTTQVYSNAVYDELSAVLVSRDAVSSTHSKLIAFFKAKGTDVTGTDLGLSNIFIGGPLN